MRQPRAVSIGMGGSGRLGERSGPLSTQVDAHIQLRDLDFVSPCSRGGYLTTGVETRTPVESSPAHLSIETDVRVSRQLSPKHCRTTIAALATQTHPARRSQVTTV